MASSSKASRIKPERRTGGRRVIDPRKGKTTRQAAAGSDATVASDKGAKGAGQ